MSEVPVRILFGTFAARGPMWAVRSEPECNLIQAPGTAARARHQP